MTAFFALVPPASTAGVRDLSSSEGHKGDYMNVKEKDVAQIGGMKYTVGSPDDVEEELGAAGDPLLVRGRRMNDAAERDQIKPDEQGGGKNWSAIYYLRVSKWGARSLCPLIFNFLVMIILEVCTYYNDTWTRSSNSVWVTSQLRHLLLPRIRRHHRARHQARVHALRVDPVPPREQRLGSLKTRTWPPWRTPAPRSE